MRAWRDLPSLRDPERFDAWLRRLLVHACMDEARKHRRHSFEVELTPIDHPTIRDSAISVAERDALERGFRRLDPEQRALIVLHHYLGLSLPEVAETMRIPTRNREVPAPPSPLGLARCARGRRQDHPRESRRADSHDHARRLHPTRRYLARRGRRADDARIPGRGPGPDVGGPAAAGLAQPREVAASGYDDTQPARLLDPAGRRATACWRPSSSSSIVAAARPRSRDPSDIGCRRRSGLPPTAGSTSTSTARSSPPTRTGRAGRQSISTAMSSAPVPEPRRHEVRLRPDRSVAGRRRHDARRRTRTDRTR